MCIMMIGKDVLDDQLTKKNFRVFYKSVKRSLIFKKSPNHNIFPKVPQIITSCVIKSHSHAQSNFKHQYILTQMELAENKLYLERSESKKLFKVDYA